MNNETLSWFRRQDGSIGFAAANENGSRSNFLEFRHRYDGDETEAQVICDGWNERLRFERIAQEAANLLAFEDVSSADAKRKNGRTPRGRTVNALYFALNDESGKPPVLKLPDAFSTEDPENWKTWIEDVRPTDDPDVTIVRITVEKSRWNALLDLGLWAIGHKEGS